MSMPADRLAVAIVGIGCRFPGGVSGPADYWRLLLDGRDAVGSIPAGRFDPALLDRPDGPRIPPFGGYLDQIDRLDADFFGISPREAERLDPQQRLLMETAWEALEDAGQNVSRLTGGRGGVFVGQWLSDFEDRLLADRANFDFFMTTGSGRYAASGRLSALLGWQGPSVTIDTACSSSLAAVHLAARSVRHGESEIALAAGVNVILAPHISIAYSRSGMLAGNGRCKFGDAAADGYVRSEGAAVVVLKSLQRAVQDGDRIYAVVLGSALNNDGGSSGSLGTPSTTGQEALLRSALVDAGLQPHQVGYIEAHGTGTRAGDPVEVGAIGTVLGRGRAAGERLLVGSAKTNLGHTEGAAGLAGLVKAVLAVHEGVIPPSLNCTVPNPSIPWDDLGCRIVTTATPWPSDKPRIAGASSFGISGTNAHILVGEPPQQRPQPASAAASKRPCVLPLSARSPEALRALAQRYAQLLAQPDAAAIVDICRNAALRRSPMDFRAAFVAEDATTMSEALTRFAGGEPADAEGRCNGQSVAPAFVAPGQGAQWLGMAQGLLSNEPVFRDALARCDEAARAYADWSIVDLIANADRPETAKLLERIDVIQPTLVALSIAYAALLGSLGVKPGALTGHSMGEVAAAHLAGVIDLDTAMRLVCRRSALMRNESGKGAMALVELSPAEARARIAPHHDKLALAALNGPTSSVLSGDPDAIAAVLAELEAAGVFCRLVKVDVASHSPQMRPAAASLTAEVAGLVPRRSLVPVYSTVLGRRADGQEFGAAYWGSNLTNPVLFADVVGAIANDGIATFVELGPHPVLLPSIQQSLPDAVLGVCGRRDEPDGKALSQLLATLWVNGSELDWHAVLPGPDNFVRLPSYAWQRERHWYAGADIVSGAGGARPAPIDDEQRSWLHELAWRALDLQPSDAGVRQATWLVAGEGPSAEAIAAALAKRGGSVRRVSEDLQSVDIAGGPGETRLIVAPGPAPDPFLPVALLKRLSQSARPPRTWIVTDGAQARDTDRPDAAGAALWGAARVAGEEWPDLDLTLVDVSGDAADADALVERVLGQKGEDQVAIRAGRCFGLRLLPLAGSPAPPVAWRSDAAYLITGGLGDIGLIIADAMVEQGARRLILMGRTALPERSTWLSHQHPPLVRRRIDAVRALEAKGASIHLACVDVADETALARYLGSYAAEGWPAIKGVLHAAGSFANRLCRDMDRASFNSVVKPKLDGAEHLDRQLPALDLFVLFSSSGGYLPQPGQANYAAANAGLEAIAQQRRLRGQHALCIAWGVWEGAGLVSDARGRANVADMERQGYLAMPPQRAAHLFAQVCAIGNGVPVVCRMDWDTFVKRRAGRKTGLFAELVHGGTDVPAADEIAGLAPEHRRARLETIVRQAVGHVLKIAPGKLAADKTLGSMGLTSLIAMELRNRLQKELQRPLSATLAWNHPTIGALVDYLAGSATQATAAPTALKAQSDSTLRGELAAVDALSEDEVLAALKAGRRKGSGR